MTEQTPQFTQWCLELTKIKALAWTLNGLLLQPECICKNPATVMNHAAELAGLILEKADSISDEISQFEQFGDNHGETP